MANERHMVHPEPGLAKLLCVPGKIGPVQAGRHREVMGPQVAFQLAPEAGLTQTMRDSRASALITGTSSNTIIIIM